MKLFVSYCHDDGSLIEDFVSHIKPLKDNGVIDDWYDRKIESGNDFLDEIDSNLTSSDIICLMLSKNFFSSPACIKEKDRALKLKEQKGVRVIPIILSNCLWMEYKDLSCLLALPTDGKPITSFEDKDEGWCDILRGIKKVCESIRYIKSLKLKGDIKSFLESTDLLAKSHGEKETLLLEDIFVFPKLDYCNQKEELVKFNSEQFKTDLLNYGKIMISGENQSGKTTLCKSLFQIYRNMGFLPIYMRDDNKYIGNPHSKLEKAFEEQYEGGDFSLIDKRRIVPIVDDFHFAKSKEKYIEKYAEYPYQILIVDDVFSLDLRSNQLIKDYNKFIIREFMPLERNELIKKWIQIKEAENITNNPNHLFQSLDEKTESIEQSLGVAFGKGIMPSYPFFILTLLSAYDSQRPLDHDITSQGYCYQALIYLYLRKQGVKNEQIDIYINFLTEFAFWLYKKNVPNINDEELADFMNFYVEQFNLPIKPKVLFNILSNVNICRYDTCNQYGFCYDYLYYFFVAKYLAEHIIEKKELVDNVIDNLHKNENAYIAIFIAHHTKANYLLEKLLEKANSLFEKYQPATLNHKELSFFDAHEKQIIKAVLPIAGNNVNENRQQLLKQKGKIEEFQTENDKTKEEQENENDFLRDLRSSIKTVEVMGMVIKNRSGSLELKQLEKIFEQGINVHLRIVTSFIQLIQNDKAEKEIVDFLTERIKIIIQNSEKSTIKTDTIEKLAKQIYWNLNFGVILGFLTKAIHSLGSTNLITIAQKIDNRINSPATFIVNQGIKLWYGKNLRIDDIAKRIEENDISKTATQLIKFKVAEYCWLHKIDYKKMQEIEKKLHIPIKKIMVEQSKQSH